MEKIKAFHLIFVCQIFFNLLLGNTVCARPLEVSDFGKVFSQNVGLPIGRQGSCLVFTFGEKRAFCLSSYHVAYNAWDENYQHKVKFEDGQSSNLVWRAGDWGRGMVLLELTNPPARSYIHWDDIPFAPEEKKVIGATKAWGFPLNTEVVNEAFGQVSKEKSKELPLFIFIDEFILVEDMASEIGFSGGGLVDDEGQYLGLLTHQIIRDQKVYTAAIPAFEVYDWADRHLAWQIENSTFFYVDPIHIQSRTYGVYMHGMNMMAQERETNATITFTFGPNEYQHLLRDHRSLSKLPSFFPLEAPEGWEPLNQFHVGRYYLLGATPYWPIEELSEAKIFSTGTEALRFMARPTLFDEEAGYYQFLNTGSMCNGLSDNVRKLWIDLWTPYFKLINPEMAPQWFKKWNSFWKFLQSKQKPGVGVTNQAKIGLLRYSVVESLLKDPEIQQDRELLKKTYPSEFFAIEEKMQSILQLHQRCVVTILAPQLLDSKK